jgi:hypothetical protein
MPTTLSDATLALIRELRETEEKVAKEQEGERVHVSHITAGLGFLYERVRNTLDYKEESLWAKNAILRMLKRKELQFLAGEQIGISVIQELIRGRYLENDAVPESKAREVDAVLAKYRLLWQTAFPEGLAVGKREESLAAWLMGIAACEIEETLRRDPREYLYFQFLYQSLRGRVEFVPVIADDEAKLQLYLASFRAFFQADTDMESWMLWRISFPEWRHQPSEELIRDIGRNLAATRGRFDAALSWPLRGKLDRLVKRRSVLVTFLRDMLGEHLDEAEALLVDGEKLEANLRQVYERRYRDNRMRLRRTAFRAVLFIFLTKVLLALGLEVPYELWIVGKVDRYALLLNTLLPPIILMAASLSIRMPGEESNFAKLLVEFNRLLAPDDEALGTIRVHKPRTTLAKMSLGILYVANFALTFGMLFWFVRAVQFNPVSAGIFILFLSIVSFFAIRLRKTANELAAVDESEHWARQLFDFLIFPIVEVGRALSWGFRSFNVVVLLFDFLLEAPFHSFIGIIEEWFAFLRERRESL